MRITRGAGTSGERGSSSTGSACRCSITIAFPQPSAGEDAADEAGGSTPHSSTVTSVTDL
ncbi:hypothetical protein GCM10022630_17520 [Thermobifida alba]